MERNTSFFIPSVGGSSLLVVFSVLCLITFALLSLNTVQAEQRLADTSMDSIISYYAADSAAELIFAQIRNGHTPAQVEITDSIYSYTCPISETQELAVSLEYRDSRWTILRWQTVSTAELSFDDSLSLWDGSNTKREGSP